MSVVTESRESNQKAVIGLVQQYFDSGEFVRELSDRVAYRTESQRLLDTLPGRATSCLAEAPPIIKRSTLSIWRRCGPWAARGNRLGFNAKYMIEMGEETGSAGLKQLVAEHKDLFAADVLIASDGPRVRMERPTVSLGCRGALNFDLVVELRDGGHHSGNWGGLIADPGLVLANALASIVSPTGELLVSALLAPPMSDAVRDTLADIEIDGGQDGPRIDTWWGQPGLAPPQRVHAANTFNVLAMVTGNPRKPVNAIPPRAVANCQFRFVMGTDTDAIVPALREHLDEHGFRHVRVDPPPPGNDGAFPATRTEPDHPWAVFVRDAIHKATGSKPAVIPSIGGSLPNDIFSDLLNLPTIWIPHSYTACSQHAPDEHVILPTCRSALEVMAAVYWDIGETGGPRS